jgi:hypothetical protein
MWNRMIVQEDKKTKLLRAANREVCMELVVEALLIIFLPEKRADTYRTRKHDRQIVLPILSLQLVLPS